MIKKIKFIDLGLPSKILWGSRNLPGFYAWGDLQKCSLDNRKKFGSIENYKFFNINTDFDLTKYNKSDGLTKLLSEDDIVTQLFGENYRIPRKEDFEELLEYTDKIFNKNSVIFKSKVNNNQIKFSAGFNSNCSIIWSSSLSVSNDDLYSAIQLEIIYNRKTLDLIAFPRYTYYKIRPIKI